MTERKQPEFILGVRKTAFLDYFHQQPIAGWLTNLRQINPFKLDEELYNDLLLAPRFALEASPDNLHFITYGVVRQRNTGKVLVYDRPVKNNGEVKLAGKRSIGIGGHVDLPDICMYPGTAAQVSLGDTLYRTALREFSEEVSFVDVFGQPCVVNDHSETSVVGMLYDPSDAVGRQHIGVITTMWINDDIQPVSNEGQILNPRMLTVEEAFSELDTFENWSKLLLHWSVR